MVELGYVRHVNARALETGRSNQIALLVQQVVEGFFLGVIQGADRAVMDAGARRRRATSLGSPTAWPTGCWSSCRAACRTTSTA